MFILAFGFHIYTSLILVLKLLSLEGKREGPPTLPEGEVVTGNAGRIGGRVGDDRDITSEGKGRGGEVMEENGSSGV